MTTERVNDLIAFRGFIDERLSGGETDLTLDEALGLWEYINAPDDDRQATEAAIREGLDDMAAGRTVSAREALAEIRLKYNIPGGT